MKIAVGLGRIHFYIPVLHLYVALQGRFSTVEPSAAIDIAAILHGEIICCSPSGLSCNELPSSFDALESGHELGDDLLLLPRLLQLPLKALREERKSRVLPLLHLLRGR